MLAPAWLAILHNGWPTKVSAGNYQPNYFAPRGKWSERRVTLPLAPAPEAGASLLGYALKKMVEHRGSAPRIPVWKTGVYLSTLMLG